MIVSERIVPERRIAASIYPSPVNRRVRVEFTELGRQVCWLMAKRRNYRKHGQNVRADWFGMDHMEANYVGVLGEAAFAVYLGSDPDSDLSISDVLVYDGYGDNGVDFDLGTHTVQVKTTRRFRDPVLSVGEWEHKTADFYVLCAYDRHAKNVVDIIGYVARDVLVRRVTPVTFTDRETGEKSRPARRIKEVDLAKFERPTEVEFGYV